MRRRWVGLLAAMAMFVAGCGGGAPEAAGPSEGIKVTGAWTIDIYNEDGSLDEHLSFHNALLSGGEILSRLLAKEISPKVWQLRLMAPVGAESPCVNNVGGDVFCSYQETTGTLSIEAIEGDTAGLRDVFQLRGQRVADKDGELLTVRADIQGCEFSDPDPPETCGGFTFGDSIIFSITDLPAPVTVNAGQTIDVTIDISFTSGP
jgi:hypothetical protein